MRDDARELPWYRDPILVSGLPARYQAYALLWRVAGQDRSRHLRGGSWTLRALKRMSRALRLPTTVVLRDGNGTALQTDFADERILEIIHEFRHDQRELHVLDRLLSEGDTFIDIGANYGTYSLSCARRVGSSGIVISIEPQAHLAACISKSAKMSRLDNVTVVQAACGAENGRTNLLVPVDDRGRGGVFPEFSGQWQNEMETVSVLTLDSICESLSRHGRMVIKIDVEGSEFDVLDGAARTIAERRPGILIELNPWSARAAAKTTASLLGRLQDMGYTTFATMTSFPDPIPVESIPTDKQCNVLAVG